MRSATHSRLGALPGYLLLFLMLFAPTSYQPVKAAALALVLLLIAGQAVRRSRIALHPAVLGITLFQCATGAAFLLLGFANGAPGARSVGTVYVLWPLVYTALVAGASDERILGGIVRVLVFAAIAIELYAFSFILHAMGLLPGALYVELDLGQKIGFYDGTIEWTLYSASSLMFLIPFLMAALMVWPRDRTLPVGRTWLWVGVLLGLALVALSGRRALQMALASAPLLTIGLWRLQAGDVRRATRKTIVTVLAGCVLAGLGVLGYLQARFGLDWAAVTTSFSAGFDFNGNASESASERADQFGALVRGWQQSPLFGAGHGAGAPGSVRSFEQPWAYELSYLALLFHTGLVGFAIHTAGVLWIAAMSLRILRSGDRLGSYALPALVGMACFLMANATNPYLEKYDGLWTLFLPVALINTYLLRRPAATPPISMRRSACGDTAKTPIKDLGRFPGEWQHGA